MKAAEVVEVALQFEGFKDVADERNVDARGALLNGQFLVYANLHCTIREFAEDVAAKFLLCDWCGGHRLYYSRHIMPRKARPHSRQALMARTALKEYLAKKGVSVSSLALSAGIAQPTLSRFLTGRTKNLTRDIHTVLKYARINVVDGIDGMLDPLDNPRVREAFARVWDGSDAGAVLIADLVEALGPILFRHTTHISRSTH